MRKIVIVASCESYRVRAFLAAAAVLRLQPVLATDAATPLWDETTHVEVDFADPAGSARRVVDEVPDAAGVVALEDAGVETSARIAAALGLVHNAPAAAAASTDKLQMRARLAGADVRQPRFESCSPGRVDEVAARIGYPVVVKPTGLTGGRGVIRADGPNEARQAEQRVRAIQAAAGLDHAADLIVEAYIAGSEIVVEGLLVDGALQVLAVMDKPDPLTGPFFEETMFVTPSRLADPVQEAAADLVRRAAASLGLDNGPLHAEVRIDPGGRLFVIELAARSIGGLCSRALTFDLIGETLETVLVRAALGEPLGGRSPTRPASGVLMLPIPSTGTLTAVEGAAEAEAIAGIDGVSITIPAGRRVVALPEGDRYLGFVFASGGDPEFVEAALRRAAARIAVIIDGEHLDSDGVSALL